MKIHVDLKRLGRIAGVVTATPFAERERERDRLKRDLAERQKVFLVCCARSSSKAAGNCCRRDGPVAPPPARRLQRAVRPGGRSSARTSS
jgi:hypothetical protein